MALRDKVGEIAGSSPVCVIGAKEVILFVSFMLFSLMGWASVDVAFYYGHNPRVIDFQNYDWLVVQKDHVNDAQYSRLTKADIKLIAYVSFGEVANNASYFDQVSKDWILESNTAWNSQILDWTNEKVQNFLVEVIAEEALSAGYSGIFLDTLDSYLMTTYGVEKQQQFQQALATMISRLRERYPNSLIIANRGFESLPLIKDKISGLAFESWYSGYRADTNKYYLLDSNDQQWLQSIIKSKLGDTEIPVIAIDYVPENDTALAAKSAEAIRRAGFIPWVSDPHLVSVGRGRLEPFPRSILALYSSKRLQFRKSNAHKWIQTSLEYLGMTLRFADVSAKSESAGGLPDFISANQYAGVLVWDNDVGKVDQKLCKWLLRQSNKGVPVVFMGRVPKHAACKTIMPGEFVSTKMRGVSLSEGGLGYGQFEGRLKPVNVSGLMYRADDKKENSWVSVKESDDKQFSPVVHGDWGGLALTPFIFEKRVKSQRMWMFDPVVFLKKALKIPDFPVPDVTTENGRRILISHVDGDGLVSDFEAIGGGMAGEVMLKEVLTQYKIPHTISIIEGETSREGVYVDRYKASESVSRKIFALPWVEVASHTFSHPFYWGIFDGRGAPKKRAIYGVHMRIPKYKATLEREIMGSVDYINRKLAPGDKKVKVFLWSGDAVPGEKALQMVDQAGLYHVNGGNTKVLPHTNSLTNVYPIGLEFETARQIYAPVMNENVYTENWTGPFYGFRNVISTFKLLDKPRRLKPMSIYYHFYSASKPSALNALIEVYEWVMKTPRNILYLSEYAERANTFYETSIRRVDNSLWLIEHGGVLNTYRIPLAMGYPDFERSKGVIGFTQINDERYISTFGTEILLALSDRSPTLSYLISSNALIDQWSWRSGEYGRRLDIKARSGEPIELVIHIKAGCEIADSIRGEVQFRKKEEDGIRIGLKFSDKMKVGGTLLECSY